MQVLYHLQREPPATSDHRDHHAHAMIVVPTLRLLAVWCLIISDYNVKAEFSCSAYPSLGGEVFAPHLMTSGCDFDGVSDDIDAVNSALGTEWGCSGPANWDDPELTSRVSTGQDSVGLSVCPTEVASLNAAAGTSFTCSELPDVVVYDRGPDRVRAGVRIAGAPIARIEKRNGFAMEGCTTENLIKLAYFTESEKERASYLIFYITVSVLICCLVTCCNPEDAGLNRSANLMRLIFVIRSYDMCSDWAFFSISLRKGGLFALVYIADGGDHGALWAVSLTFCILGTIIYFPDIRMLYKRTPTIEQRHRATESDVRRATIISVLSFSFLLLKCVVLVLPGSMLTAVWGGALHRERVCRRGIILHRPRRQNCYNGTG